MALCPYQRNLKRCPSIHQQYHIHLLESPQRKWTTGHLPSSTSAVWFPFTNLHRIQLTRYNVAFYGTDATKKQELVDQVRSACLAKGFFQITNHGIPEELQDAVFEQSRAFFSLPL